MEEKIVPEDDERGRKLLSKILFDCPSFLLPVYSISPFSFRTEKCVFTEREEIFKILAISSAVAKGFLFSSSNVFATPSGRFIVKFW